MRLSYVSGASPDKWAKVWNLRHPEQPLRMWQLAEREQWAALDANEAELAIVRLPDEPNALSEARARGYAIELYRERSVVALPREHPFADEAQLRLADIAELTLAPEQPELADTLALVAAGVGVAVLPMSEARLHHRRDLVPIPLSDGAEWPVLLAWRADSELVQDFVGITRGRSPRSSRAS